MKNFISFLVLGFAIMLNAYNIICIQQDYKELQQTQQELKQDMNYLGTVVHLMIEPKKEEKK